MSLNDLPGAEIILPGLSDLHSGESNTIGALLVAIAATRLTEAGLDIPRYYLTPEPELTLYARLQNEREDAYHYYNALLNRLNSFCNALELSYKYKPSNKALEPTSKRSSKVKDCLRRLNITVIDPNRSRVDMFSSWDITHRLKPLT